jgi:hypothetical protein
VDSPQRTKPLAHLQGKKVQKFYGHELNPISSPTRQSANLTTTISTTPTSSTIAPSNTGPGTYYIVNVATNTAMDLLYGNPTNDTEINGW